MLPLNFPLVPLYHPMCKWELSMSSNIDRLLVVSKFLKYAPWWRATNCFFIGSIVSCLVARVANTIMYSNLIISPSNMLPTIVQWVDKYKLISEIMYCCQRQHYYLVANQILLAFPIKSPCLACGIVGLPHPCKPTMGQR